MNLNSAKAVLAASAALYVFTTFAYAETFPLTVRESASVASVSANRDTVADSTADEVSDHPQAAGGRPLRVTGRLVYDYDSGPDGVDTIYVEVRDQDLLDDSIVWTGFTNQDGFFDTGVTNWTEGDDPDLYIFFQASTPAVTVERGILEEDYTFSNADNAVDDFQGEFYDFGTFQVVDEDLNAVFKIHNTATRVNRFIAQETGVVMPNVEIIWPSGDFDFDYDGEITLGEFLPSDGAIAHQMAHHLQVTQNFPVQQSTTCGGWCEVCGDASNGCNQGSPNCPFDSPASQNDAMKEGFAMWFTVVFCDHLRSTYVDDAGDPDFCTGSAPASTIYPATVCDQCDTDPMTNPLATASYLSSFLSDLEVPDDTLQTTDIPPEIFPRDYNGDGFVECAAVGYFELLDTFVQDKPATFVDFVNAYITRYAGRAPYVYQVAENFATGFPALLPADTELPGVVGPDEYFSPSHTPATTQRTLPCIDLEWTAFDDDVTGGRMFSLLWNGNAVQIPDTVAEVDDPCPSATSPAYPPGDYFVNIRTRDWSGKWSDDFARLGPFTVEDCNNNGAPDLCELSWNIDPADVLSCDIPTGFCDGVDGTLFDCNENFIIDECEISAGDAEDCNLNGRPDGFPCETIRKWDGDGGDGLWENDTNWENNQLPTASSYVCFGEDNPGLTIAVTSGTAVAAGLASYGGIAIQSTSFPWPSLELFDDSFIRGNFTIQGTLSKLIHDDELVVDGMFNFLDRATIEGAGTTIVRGGIMADGSTTVGADHSLRLEDGDGDHLGRITGNSNATITIGSPDGGPSFTHNVTKDNIAFTGINAMLIVDDTGRVNIQSGGNTSVNMPMEIDGIVNVQADSSLVADRPITCTGEYFGDVGTTITLVGGQKNFNSTSRLTGDTILFDNGIAGDTVIRGDYGANISQFMGGTVVFSAIANVIDYGDQFLLSGNSNVTLNPESGLLREFDVLDVRNATLVVNATDPIATDDFDFGSGLFQGNASLNFIVRDNFTWDIGASFRSIGGVNLLGQSIVMSPFGGQKLLDTGTTMRNYGTMTLDGTFTCRMGSAFVNMPSGVVACILDDRLIIEELGAPVQNHGAFRKSAGTGITTIEIDFENTGTVGVETGQLTFAKQFTQFSGVTELTGGDLRVGPDGQSVDDADVQGGQLTGVGTLIANLVTSNDAIVRPGDPVGVLNVDGNYTQGPSATLAIEIDINGKATVSDQLAVAGVATLDGSLLVSLRPGATVTAGEQFTVLTATDVQQTFDGVISIQNWLVTYTPTEVILTAQSSPSCGTSSTTDLDADCDVDLVDFEAFNGCVLGADTSPSGDCLLADFDASGVVYLTDYAVLQRCHSGDGQQPTCGE